VAAENHGGTSVASIPLSVLVFIVGPPAVGKMTVGHELAARTGMRLFHNHQTIDLVLPYFEFGTPPFRRLVHEFRRRIFEEVAESDLPGLIFTFVWAFDDPRDAAVVEEYAEIFRQRGAPALFVELQASQEERLRRNETEFRLAQKPFKRDLPLSRQRLLDDDVRYQLDSNAVHDDREDYFRIDTTELTAADTAERIITHFGLQTIENPKRL
jgi:hypothetical protein